MAVTSSSFQNSHFASDVQLHIRISLARTISNWLCHVSPKRIHNTPRTPNCSLINMRHYLACIQEFHRSPTLIASPSSFRSLIISSLSFSAALRAHNLSIGMFCDLFQFNLLFVSSRSHSQSPYHCFTSSHSANTWAEMFHKERSSSFIINHHLMNRCSDLVSTHLALLSSNINSSLSQTSSQTLSHASSQS